MYARYGRILVRFWKNSLIRDMTFRGHFFLNVISNIMWVGMLLIFVTVIFNQTPGIRGWNKNQYLFLMGTHMLVTSVFSTFFLGNCWRVSELVRTGDLDFVLVRPASAQFLLSFERVDYSSLANVPVGIALCAYGVWGQGQAVGVTHLVLFVTLIGAGVLILYSLLFIFAITSVWLIRLTGLNDLWFYTVSLARYPAEIYRQFVGGALWFVLVFVIPVLMVSNLPANVMIRSFEPFMVGYVLAASLVLLLISTVVLRFALRWYRSASS